MARGQSAAFMARIRKLRGKRSIKQRTEVKMAKRRYKAARSRLAKHKYSRAGLSGVLATGLGVGGYILFESLVEPKLISMANISNPLYVNIAELGLGIWASRKSGVIGSVGKAAVVINLYQILHPYLSTIGTSSSSTSLSLWNSA